MTHIERASINFILWSSLYETERPFQVFLDKDLSQDGTSNTNLSWEEKDVYVSNFRGNADYMNIDNHGFTSRALPGFDTLRNTKEIQSTFIPAIQELLQRELEDAGTVFVYDWRIRDSSTYYPNGRVDFGDQSSSLLPSNFAHVDVTPISIIRRIEKSFPEDADAILAQRIRAINVWKPVDNEVDQWSLALCDGNTIKPFELVETDSVRRDSIATLYYVQHNPGQKWHFLHKQTTEEALIFKHFDSKPDVKSSFAMHSSIKHHRVSANAKPRRSIEVRTLVFSGQFEPSTEES